MPSSSSVRITRIAISPRLATRTLSNICGRGGYRPGVPQPRTRGGATVAGVRRAALLLCLGAVGLACAASPASAALRFRDCGGDGIRCARLSVPLDRAGAVPGRVSLLVIRRRANRPTGKPPLIFLAGGPGQPAIEALFGF